MTLSGSSLARSMARSRECSCMALRVAPWPLSRGMLALAVGGMARTLQRAARERHASTQLRTVANGTGMRAIQGLPGTACAGSVRPAAARLLHGLREGPHIRPCASPGLPCGRCSSMTGLTETPNRRAELLMGQCGGLAAGS